MYHVPSTPEGRTEMLASIVGSSQFSSDFSAFLRGLVPHLPKEFFTAPATRRYHAPMYRVEGGLFLHTLAAYNLAGDLLRFYGIEDQRIQQGTLAAVLFHDAWKCWDGSAWQEKATGDHGPVAARWLDERYAAYGDVKGTIYRQVEVMREGIEKHMTRWSMPPVYPESLPLHALVVALADYFVSRSGFSFTEVDFGGLPRDVGAV